MRLLTLDILDNLVCNIHTLSSKLDYSIIFNIQKKALIILPIKTWGIKFVNMYGYGQQKERLFKLGSHSILNPPFISHFLMSS